MTVADWKAALLTLSDGPFFDLMRSYLGDIRTPFNKQRLVDELEGFLGRKDIQETVAAYLDATDRRVIAAMGALGDPVPDELASFFDGELSYAELHAVLLNLEERLIVYRFSDGASRRLALNPALESVLAPISADQSPLFPSLPIEEAPEEPAAKAPLDDLFLAAVVAFVRRRSELFRTDGSYRKKTLEDVASSFAPERFMDAVDALHALGILDMDDEGVRIDEQRLSSFAALPRVDRSYYLAAGLCGAGLDAAGKKRSGHVSRERLVLWARLFKSFLESLSYDRAYPAATLSRLIDAAERAVAAPRRRRWEERPGDRGAELRAGADPARFRSVVLAALTSVGALEPRAGDLRSRRSASGPEVSNGPALSADAAFSVIVYPEIAFGDAVELTRFLDVREAGRTARFELCRESAVRGFDGGLSPDMMLEILERLSGRQAAQNVRWSLAEWHKRYAAVAVYRGVVLTVSEDRRYLMEVPAVAAVVSRVLAPGVYLLNAETEADAAAVLEKAGLDIVALPKSEAFAEGPRDEARFSVFSPLDRGHESPRASVRRGAGTKAPPPSVVEDGADAASSEAGAAGARLASLRSALDRKSLPKDQKDELGARLARRVILVESQLVGAAVRYEKLEAKGLDYVGKVRVAEQALATGSLVEIFWRGPRGDPNRVLGVPVSLDKSGGEVEFSVEPAPRGDRIAVAVGKISLIRRIKRSIFGE